MFYRMKCATGRARRQLAPGKSVPPTVFRHQALAESRWAGFKQHHLPLRAEASRSCRRQLVLAHLVARLNTPDDVNRPLVLNFVVSKAVAAKRIGVFVGERRRLVAGARAADQLRR